MKIYLYCKRCSYRWFVLSEEQMIRDIIRTLKTGCPQPTIVKKKV